MFAHTFRGSGPPSWLTPISGTEAGQSLAMDSTSTVQLRGIEKRFGYLRVLSNIDLEIVRGEVLVFIGPSGSGKTTLLRCVAGLEQCDRGEIKVFGQPVTTVWKLGGQVGFVFQQF